jgi:hypothetical protein
MPTKVEAVLPSDELRAHTRSYQKRLASLHVHGAQLRELRLLQFTLVQEYLKGQRYFIALHSKLLSQLAAESQPHFLQRQEALKLFSALSELYDLMRAVNADIADLEAHDRDLHDSSSESPDSCGPSDLRRGSRHARG